MYSRRQDRVLKISRVVTSQWSHASFQARRHAQVEEISHQIHSRPKQTTGTNSNKSSNWCHPCVTTHLYSGDDLTLIVQTFREARLGLDGLLKDVCELEIDFLHMMKDVWINIGSSCLPSTVILPAQRYFLFKKNRYL